MKFKRIISLLMLIPSISVCADTLPTVRINNYLVNFGDDQGAKVIDGTTYIPLRKIGELCHYEVDWKDDYAEITGDSNVYKIYPDANLCYKNDEEIQLTTYMSNDRILVSVEDAKAIFDLNDDIVSTDDAIALHQEFKYNDDKYYDLVTTFIGDAKTERGFAWEAELDYDDMVLQYKKADSDTLVDVTPTCEKQPVSWVNNKTNEEVPIEVYDADCTQDDVAKRPSMQDYKLFYKAELTNLEPGTAYSYRIGSTSKNDFSEFYTFTTEPEIVDGFSIIGVTDPQGRVMAEYDYYSAVLNKADEECPNPAFVLNCGDFTDNAYFDDWWRYFFESSKAGKCESVPLMTVVGNHEQRGDCVKYYNFHFYNPQNAKGLAEGYVADETVAPNVFKEIENIDNTVYSFDYGDAHFAVLNTGSDWDSSSELLQLQKEWLRNDLNSSDKKWKVVALHRGVYVEKIRSQAPKEVFLDVIDECNVDLVLEGHDHTYMRTHIMKNDAVSETGTIYALIGSAALKRYAAADVYDWIDVISPIPSDLPNYVVISFDEDKISYTAKLLDGTEIDSFEITK